MSNPIDNYACILACCFSSGRTLKKNAPKGFPQENRAQNKGIEAGVDQNQAGTKNWKLNFTKVLKMNGDYFQVQIYGDFSTVDWNVCIATQSYTCEVSPLASLFPRRNARIRLSLPSRKVLKTFANRPETGLSHGKPGFVLENFEIIGKLRELEAKEVAENTGKIQE